MMLNPFGGLVDPLVQNMLRTSVENYMSTRSRMVNEDLDKRRSINDECGYPETENLTPEIYRTMYDREPVATRVVDVLPKETWQVQPTVFETEDLDQDTEFEKVWDSLGKQLRGEESWYQDEGGSVIWSYLVRLDEMSGIASYGVMLLGLDDGVKSLDEPARPGKSKGLLYVRVFDESLAPILEFETDVSSRRFGQPLYYDITFNDPRDQTGSAHSIGGSSKTQKVHWTRVIHVADNQASSEIFGVPRQRPVWNPLLDIHKVRSASAEMYYKGAFPGISWETHPQLGGDVNVNSTTLKEQIEQYSNSLQRYMITMGMSAKMLSPTVVDPTPQINAYIDSICVQKGIPKRIFLGSERGELSSSQDSRTWTKRLNARQQLHVTPNVIVPFVDRLIWLGVLPQPKGYSAVWPDIDSLTPEQQSAIAVQRTEAMAKYVGGNVQALITPLDFLVKVVGMEQSEAEEVVESAGEQEDDDVLAQPEEPEEGEVPPGEEDADAKEEEGTKPGDEKKEAGKSKSPFPQKKKTENVLNVYNPSQLRGADEK